VVDIKLQWRNNGGMGTMLREVEFKYRQGDSFLCNVRNRIPDNKYESIGMKFKLK
jgi:hypothetical protein